jgi:aspartate kinase
MHIVKFGGSSIATAHAIRQVVQIVADRPDPTVVVLSAMADTTDRLDAAGAAAAEGRRAQRSELVASLSATHDTAIGELALPATIERTVRIRVDEILHTISRLLDGSELLEDLSPVVRARLLAYGELLSSRIVTAALEASGLPARWFDSRELIITSPGDPLASEPDEPRTGEACRAMLRPALDDGLLPVVQGFLGQAPDGRTSLLGRGGSDCTAALLGAALHADGIDIWTDVDGILTADPTLVPEASLVSEMSFAEAAELAFFGARVLHPKTLVPAVQAGIPVRVRNTQRPTEPGTLIRSDATTVGAIKSIAYKEGITLIRLTSARMFRSASYLASVLDRFERAGVTADALATTEVSASIAVCQPPPLEPLLGELRALGTVSTVSDQSLVCIVGEGLRSRRGVVARIFDDLVDIPISMVSQGGSELAVAFVVADSDLAPVVRRLHRRFFEGDTERSRAATGHEGSVAMTGGGVDTVCCKR